MNEPSIESAARRGSIWGFLADPFLLVFGGFLAVMIALSFAHPTLHGLAMRVRWPVLGLTAVAGAATAMLYGLPRLRPTHFWMICFLVIGTASSLYAVDRRYTFERSVSIWLLFAATGVGLFAYCQTLERIQRLTNLLWMIGAAVVVMGAVYRMGSMGPGGRYEGMHSRATGAGTYAALFLPFAVYQVRYRLTGFWRLIGWGVVGLLGLQILLAGARMAIVTAGFVSVVLWLDYYGRRAIAAIIALGVLASVPLLLNGRNIERLKERSASIVRADSLSTFTGRLDRWVFGWEQFRLKPVLGHGLGSSRHLAGLEDPRRFDIKPGEVFNLHSDQIEVLMDTGIVGYTPFALFWLTLVVTGASLWRRRRDPVRQLGLAYMGAVVYAFGDTFMHGGFLAAGGGVSAFTWSQAFTAVALSSLPALTFYGPSPQTESPGTGASPMVAAQTRRPARLPSARALVRAE